MTNHLASSLFCGQQLCLASAELIPAVVNNVPASAGMILLWICWTCSSLQLFQEVDVDTRVASYKASLVDGCGDEPEARVDTSCYQMCGVLSLSMS